MPQLATREELVKGLRDLAGLIEHLPTFPVPDFPRLDFAVQAETDEEGILTVRSVAEHLSLSYDERNGIYSCDLYLDGLRLNVFYVTQAARERHRQVTSYHGNIEA
jgi:hypothetical protein